MKLINRTNRMKVIPLPHHSYCKALGRCVCIQLAGMKGKVATSLTIPAEMTSAALEDAVLQVPQVDRMVRRGELTIESVKETTKTKRQSPPSTASTEETGASKKKSAQRSKDLSEEDES